MHSPNLLPAIAIVMSSLALMLSVALYVLMPRSAPAPRPRRVVTPAPIASSEREDIPGFCQVCWRPVSDVGVLTPTTYLIDDEAVRRDVCVGCRSAGELHVAPVLHVDVSDMQIPAVLPARPRATA